jgi:hypothetical protein
MHLSVAWMGRGTSDWNLVSNCTGLGRCSLWHRGELWRKAGEFEIGMMVMTARPEWCGLPTWVRIDVG